MNGALGHTGVLLGFAAAVIGVVVLGVQMTDTQGTAWLATYTLERQPDGLFLIEGCELVENEGRYT